MKDHKDEAEIAVASRIPIKSGYRRRAFFEYQTVILCFLLLVE